MILAFNKIENKQCVRRFIEKVICDERACTRIDVIPICETTQITRGSSFFYSCRESVTQLSIILCFFLFYEYFFYNIKQKSENLILNILDSQF